MKKCPHCGEELPDRGEFCSRCGRQVGTPAPEAELARPKRCRSCGAQNANTMTKCGSCGAPLDSSAVAAVEAPPTSSHVYDWSPWNQEPPPPSRGRLSSGLNIASLLLMGSGASALISIMLSLYQMSCTDALADACLPTDFFDVVVGVVAFCLSVMMVGAIMAFATAYMLRISSRNLTLCLLGAGIAILGVGPMYIGSVLAFVALVIIAISGEEFE